MQTVVPEKQAASERSLLEWTAQLKDDFAGRAAEHDRDGSFPFENYETLRQSGYLALTVPPELGGRGIGMVELGRLIELMAHGCGSTALGTGMHLAHLGHQAEEWRETGNPKIARFLEACGRNEILLSGAMSESETGGQVQFATTTATRVDGGFVINGKKIFCTLAPGMTHFRSNGAWDSPDGIQMVNYVVPRDTRGLLIQNDWDTMGMRASGSPSIKLDNMFVPDECVWYVREPGVWDKFLTKMLLWGTMGSAVVYLGLAQAMRDFAVTWALKRVRFPAPRPVAHEPGPQHAVARMDTDLIAARTLLYSLAEEWERGSDDVLQEAFLKVSQARYFLMQAVIRVAHEALYLVGGQSYYKSLPLERMYRDVISGPFRPPNFDYAQEVLGKLAFNIPLDTEPRWG